MRFNIACLILFLTLAVSQVTLGQDSQVVAVGKIETVDESFSTLIDPDAKIEVLASGYQWSEGPVWLKEKNVLLFSDVPKNKIYQWSDDSGASVFLNRSGFDTGDRADGIDENEPGSNGLILDHQNRIVVCDHGNRRVYRIEKDGSKKTLADRFNGKRFNSPNDLVIHANGDIYFTDPPYGLRNPAQREIDFCGVYRIANNGEVTLLTKEFQRPNGIALSPDQKTLYVAQSHRPEPVIKAFPLKADGTLDGKGKVLFDVTKFAERGDQGMPDGLAIDVQGNLWCTGPGGVLVISPQGKLLGRILPGKKTANCTFGDDGSTLYMTSTDRLCRVKTKTIGLGFTPIQK